jgi:hypothetical protein
MRHELKCQPQFFQAAWAGAKPFEIRKNDRKFSVHDEVCLQEYDLVTDTYSGREIEGFIRYVTDFKQQKGYVVFSVDEIGRRDG